MVFLTWVGLDGRVHGCELTRDQPPHFDQHECDREQDCFQQPPSELVECERGGEREDQHRHHEDDDDVSGCDRETDPLLLHAVGDPQDSEDACNGDRTQEAQPEAELGLTDVEQDVRCEYD